MNVAIRRTDAMSQMETARRTPSAPRLPVRLAHLLYLLQVRSNSNFDLFDLTNADETIAVSETAVSCECQSGFVGDGNTCNGNLWQTISETPQVSDFFKVSSGCCVGVVHLFRAPRLLLLDVCRCIWLQLLQQSDISSTANGSRLIDLLKDPEVNLTLFIPVNGLPYKDQVKMLSSYCNEHSWRSLIIVAYAFQISSTIDAVVL